MKKIILASMLLATLSGCSSIVSDSSYPVAITSQPSNASFTITNEDGATVHKGVTPSTVTLSSSNGFFDGAEYTIICERDGFEPVTYTVTSSIDGWYFGNILFGGLIGLLIIDPATGAMWKLPEEASMELVSSNTGNEDNLTVMTLSNVPAEYQDQLMKL